MNALLALVRTWLVLDFFGESRRSGAPGSSLTTAVAGQGFLALAIAALLYPEVEPVPFAAVNLSLSTLLVGLAVLGEPGRAARARIDRLLVRTAPLPGNALAVARVVHGLVHLCVLVTGMALPPAILLSFRSPAGWTTLPLYLLAALASAATLALAIEVLARTATLLLGALRAELLLATLKTALLAVGLAGFLVALRHLDESVTSLPGGGVVAHAWPPYLAALWLAAPLDPRHAIACAGPLAALALLAAWLPDAEPRRDRPARANWRDRLAARLAGPGPQLGVTLFTAVMMRRSAGFRTRVGPLFGLPLAVLIAALVEGGGAPFGWRTSPLLLLAQFPTLLVPFVVGFLPRGEQPAARWVFASAPIAVDHLGRNAARITLFSHLLVPTYLVTLAILLVCGVPMLPAAAFVGFALGLGGLAAHWFTRGLAHVPFTGPKQRDEMATDLGGILGLGMVLAIVTVGFTELPGPWAQACVALLVLGLGWPRVRAEAPA